MNRKRRRSVVDAAAAQVILQSWLDATRTDEAETGPVSSTSVAPRTASPVDEPRPSYLSQTDPEHDRRRRRIALASSWSSLRCP